MDEAGGLYAKPLPAQRAHEPAPARASPDHNQEIGLGLLEDYGHSRAHDRDTLLLACAHHTAGHQKFGEPLEAYRKFAEALA